MRIENLGAMIDRQLKFKTSINDEQFIRLKRGEENVYLFGVVNYQDIFGESRSTSFCYESQRPDGRNRSFWFAPCYRNNDGR